MPNLHILTPSKPFRSTSTHHALPSSSHLPGSYIQRRRPGPMDGSGDMWTSGQHPTASRPLHLRRLLSGGGLREGGGSPWSIRTSLDGGDGEEVEPCRDHHDHVCCRFRWRQPCSWCTRIAVLHPAPLLAIDRYGTVLALAKKNATEHDPSPIEHLQKFVDLTLP